MTPPSPAFSPDWREGRYFDLWMLVHFASGVAGGFSNVFFGLNTLGVFALATALMLLWELIEQWKGVVESWSNRALDIVVGLLGVQLALWIASTLTQRQQRLAFVSSFATASALSAVGWVAYRRRRRGTYAS